MYVHERCGVGGKWEGVEVHTRTHTHINKPRKQKALHKGDIQGNNNENEKATKKEESGFNES
jgi:hypothetical protein